MHDTNLREYNFFNCIFKQIDQPNRFKPNQIG